MKKDIFNIGVDAEKYIRKDNGEILIYLGESKIPLKGKVDRKANQNGTPRIFCGPEFIRWVQKHYRLKEKVDLNIVSPS